MSGYPFGNRVWTEVTVVSAILAEDDAGLELSYSCTRKRVPSLVRAAERVFGTWAGAVRAAGFDYEAIRRYRKWTSDRVIARIRELHQQGADLSWRHVSLTVDPPLAAAVAHGNRFASWSEALQAAGIDPATMARYRHWTLDGVQAALQRLNEQGVPLDRRTLIAKDAALLAAVYRHGNGLITARWMAMLSQSDADSGSIFDAA